MNVIRGIFVVLLSLVVNSVSAQTEMPDSLLSVRPDSIESFMVPRADTGMKPMDRGVASDWLTAPSLSLPTRIALAKEMPMQYSLRFTEDSYLASWSGGGVVASGSMTQLPGLMGIESGRVALIQQFDRLSLSLSVSADKYGYFRGLQTGYGVGLNINYRFAPNLSLTLFGNYYSPVRPLTPAMAGYMNSSNFGGYLSYDFAPHWGVSVGAQTERSFYNGRWETRPIVMPYYKISDDVKIGADVGGIIYEVLRAVAGPAPRQGTIPPPPPHR